ncbi:hypothetical protein QCA50_005949 [Cerrena zonata]|uniref:UDENN domain-containing protein n=1 Tax=Cerrena zonata TaxID=2478898 RepID=A0AAW0GEF8_9APHY
MEEETDIGLTNLSSKTFSAMQTPPRRSRPSVIKISRRSTTPTNSPLKSPSSPNLFKDAQLATPSPRRLSRSNTLPRLASQRSESSNIGSLDLESLTMGEDKVARLRRWIYALVIVDFDLEYGPKITKFYPSLTITPSENENIAFSSFPDAPQTEEGSQLHSFRIRQVEQLEDKTQRPDPDRPQSVDGFMYGFSCFTQRKDPSSKRGYQQRSLVILTKHSYPALFYTLLFSLGQSFLHHGGPMLEAACHNIATWSDPLPGSTLELGFLGSVYTVELPSSSESPQSQAVVASLKAYDQDTRILASIPPSYPPIIAAFEACIPHLWSIWECLVLCEPILVFGPSAAMVSQVVWWLRDIVKPLPLTGDFRPFFTIHDADYTTFVNPRQPQSGILLAWDLQGKFTSRSPNSFTDRPIRNNKALTPKTPRTPWATADTSSVFSAGPPPGWKTKIHKRYISRDQALLKRCEEACLRGDLRAKLEASNALRQHFSQRTTAFLVPLQRYLNTLIPTPAESATVTNFPSLPSISTSSLVTSGGNAMFPPSPSSYLPKSSSVTSLTYSSPGSSAPSPTIGLAPSIPSTRAHTPSPLHVIHTPFQPGTPIPANCLRLKPFSTSAFLASLSPSSSSTTPAPPSLLPFKSSSKQRDFYDRWLKTRAFGVWLGEQEEVVKAVLEKRAYEL